MAPEQPERAVTTEPEPDYELDAKLALAAKVERFLGSKDAGMLDAMRWANSSDPQERILAAQVFADMATPDTLTYEQTLSRDTDRTVAAFASRQIKYWGSDNPYKARNGFERQPILS